MLFLPAALAAVPLTPGFVTSGGYPDLFAVTAQLDVSRTSLEVGYGNLMYLHTLVGRVTYFLGPGPWQVGPSLTVRSFHDPWLFRYRGTLYVDDWASEAVHAGMSARFVSRSPGVLRVEVVAGLGGDSGSTRGPPTPFPMGAWRSACRSAPPPGGRTRQKPGIDPAYFHRRCSHNHPCGRSRIRAS